MKKLLFFAATLWIVAAVFGQSVSLKNINQLTKHERNAVRDIEVYPSIQPSPYFPKAGQGLFVVGTTAFDAISNSSARNTVSALPDGDMVNVWTFLYGTKRGTGYNWYDKEDNSWDVIPTERLEDLEEGNPGFPTHAFTETGEIIVSHIVATNGLVLLTRDQRGTGAWEQTSIIDSNYPNGLVWPTVSASGNTVHLMCLADLGMEIYKPLYYRSKDGGKTWDINAIDFPQVPDKERNLFADNYVMVSKGEHVVFAWCDLEYGNVGYVESLNGGNTWTHKQVYECNFNFETSDLVPPTFFPTTATVAIDDNDIVHVAFGGFVADRPAGTAPNYWRTYGFYSGITYWKSSMDIIFTPSYFNIEYVMVNEQPEVTNLGYEVLPNFLGIPDLLGFNEWWIADTVNLDMIDGANGRGAVYAPRIVAEDGYIYLFYGSILEYPIGIFSGQITVFHRGTFLTVSDDNGDSFDQKNKTSWMSYHKNLYFCDWSKYKGPVDPDDPDKGLDGTISIKMQSENRWPTMAIRSGNQRLLLQWANTYTAGPLTEEYDIISIVLEKNLAGVYNNTQEVWNGKWNDYNLGVQDVTGGIQDMIIFPNPAQNVATVSVNSICNKSCTLSVMNLMGQVILTQKGELGYGENIIQLNINNLASGVYLVNIKTDNATRTQKLIVQ